MTGRPIAIADLFARPTIREMAKLLTQAQASSPVDLAQATAARSGLRRAAMARRAQTVMDRADPMTNADQAPFMEGASDSIAIVGMTGRFPGAGNVEEFWEGQRTGRISISQIAPDELEDRFGEEVRRDPAFVAARGLLEATDMFDADLFGMYAREAKLTDPQHRIFLEICLEALELAGIDAQRADGPIGVFAGSSMPTYLINNVLADRSDAEDFTSNYQLGGMDTLVGSLPDALATRVAYKLDLKGPAMTVQSACSTSLLAVAQACQSLLFYQCDAALAGGVSITFPQRRGYLYQDGGMGSRDGTVRPFDRDACGTVFGSGAAVVVLKRLDDALRNGDEIIAVIRGWGIANDGASKAALTAPSAEGQARAISAAIAESGVAPETIGYVELHGTATPLGDPIEFDGLVRAFGPVGAPGSCVLGSAKANIGHLDAAAGVTGLIKAALCLREEEIPPLANFTAPNPHIDLDGSAFRIEGGLTPWPRTLEPRRAGVSSFGVGGTNVHVVLEEAPARPERRSEKNWHILPFSALSDEALEAQARALSAHLAANPDLDLADVAFTLAEGRTERAERGAVVADTVGEAARKLSEFGKRSIRGRAGDTPPVVFMFPGQGSQYPGMGRELYASEPVFRDWIDRGAQALEELLGLDIRTLLFEGDVDAQDHPIRATVHAQPALFLTQYALAQLWISRGIEPAAMIGHSVGELVAACVSGVLSFEDGLALVARRAQLMQSAEPGAMLVVRSSEAETAQFLGDGVDLAAVNAPSLCVVAGPFEAIERLETRLEESGIESRRLHTSHAFHSAMMEPVVAELEKLASTFTYGPPQIPYVSCVTGDWADAASGADGAYWARHCRQPVRFAEALRTVVATGAPPVLIEVGAGRTLSTFAGQTIDRDAYRATVTSMPEFAGVGTDDRHFTEAVARLWVHGERPRLAAPNAQDARRVRLPAYQFQRKSYWVAPKTAEEGTMRSSSTSEPNERTDILRTTMQPTQPAIPADRVPRIRDELARLLEDLSGEVVEPADYGTEFLNLGFDSLFLGQVSARVQKQFAVKVTFRQLMDDLVSIDALARHLDTQMPAEAAPAVAQPAPAPVLAATSPVIVDLPPEAPATLAGHGLAATFQAQLDAMKSVIDRQLAIIDGKGLGAPQAVSVATDAPTPIKSEAPSVIIAPAPSVPEGSSRFRAFDPKTASHTGSMTAQQAAFVADMAAAYSRKMPTSKAQAQENRAHFSDPRTAAGFRPEWKEMVFPVVAERSKGSKIWDPDGNEFVDLVNGYGQTAFGHSPDFVVEAVARQLEKGFAIGPQSPLAGKVAKRIADMVRMDRVTFCNTGSEAVMAAMRVARCVTGRDKVVVFNNDYHGQFDEVLVKAGGKAFFSRALPIAPGIPPESVENMVVLPYGATESLDWIKAHMDEVAAVVVEPVQSRHPDLLPFEFLKDLREATATGGTALVFDEVVTGFRAHPGGMQAILGIEADMATYGKVIGGGMPVGILAGAAQYLDALDGGAWNYGDDSFPEVAPTFFAGTFVRHPLVLAACNAVLDHLEAGTPAMQEELAGRTKSLVRRMENEFAVRGLAIDIPTYSSWFMLDLAGLDRLASLFQFQMRLRGVHVLEGYPCFLTTAHSDADLDAIVEATGAALDALQSVGILLPANSSEQPAAPPPPAPAREVPLTESQLEILLAAQMGPEASCAYNESITLEFDAHVDADALKGALGDFIARHDAMRATVGGGSEPNLQISSNFDFELPVAVEADSATVDEARAREARTPFDLSEGPLVRGSLFQMSDGRSQLVFTGHHIVFDGWTANLFAEEVAAFYRQRTLGTPVDLPPALSFAEYAREQARPSRAETDLAYWRAQFADLPAPLEIPGDRPRPATKTFAGATVTDTLDSDLVKAARKVGAANGCTLFATLFGALQATVGRIAEATDVVLGCPTAGQALIDDRSLAGHCVNFLPLRARFTMDTPIGDHLREVRKAVLEGFEHQSATYGSIVRALGIHRDPNRTPLTDVQFNLERLGEAIDFGGVAARLLPNPKAAVNFDLFFNMVESTHGLRIDVDYATDLFDETTIRRWIENFRQVLRALVADDRTPIGELAIIGEDERRWLAGRNPVAPLLPEDSSIPALFSRVAARYPDRIALAADGRSMTYAELDGRSNRLAHTLAARGVGGGDCVALLSGRSIEAVELILAINKTGAAFVPLDPSYPASRQAYVLSDCGAALVLTGPGADAAEAYEELSKTAIDYRDLSKEASSLPDRPLDRQVPADDPIYVMYTSGSTGQPKGVIVPHRGVTRLVVDQDYIDFGPDRTFLLLTALGFDMSQLEIWGALLFGGKLAIVTGAKPSLDEISSVIVEQGVDSAWLVSALFHLIVEERVQALAPLKQLVIGGDVVSRSHVRRAQAALPHVRFVNGYGPTENSCLTTCYVFPSEGWGPGSSPIGPPIVRSSVFIIDDRGRISPQGSVGELWTGGEGVAIGYHGKPELTAERFVAASRRSEPTVVPDRRLRPLAERRLDRVPRQDRRPDQDQRHAGRARRDRSGAERTGLGCGGGGDSRRDGSRPERGPRLCRHREGRANGP